ncbi:hypothetical protein [Amycolatopsis sp. NPDC059657]|uniref:hypothetical protein n=1 Tax=Amycolatopsis sp. NPDC059657 TaxID=3346899 RepID=UPI00367314B9
MKMFGKVLMGTVAGAVLLAFAPGADAATTKELWVHVYPSTLSVNVTINGKTTCYGLPPHNEAWVPVLGLTPHAGDRGTVIGFDSRGCNGSPSTRSERFRFRDIPVPERVDVKLTR